MLIIIETRIGPSMLYKKFNQLGFDSYEYTDNKGFVGGIYMGCKKDKIQIQLLQKHFQFLHVKIKLGKKHNGIYLLSMPTLVKTVNKICGGNLLR